MPIKLLILFMLSIPGPLLAWQPAGEEQASSEATPNKTKANPNLQLRGQLDNSRLTFARTGKGHVAFMGGSITEMNGYRPRVASWLSKEFPDTKFNFTNAGVSSTCSTTGAFRLADEVLQHGPVDLFFVEFAVNDDQDAAHAARECVRGLEGVVRQLRRHNPNADIVVVYFVNPGMLKTSVQGEVPLTIANHQKVAIHYQLPSVNVAGELAARTIAGTFSWKKYGGTHPGSAGNDMAASLVTTLMSKAWGKELAKDAKVVAHPMLRKPLDSESYFDGHYVPMPSPKQSTGWQVSVPNWREIAGSKRSRFVKQKLLWADKPGAEMSVPFTGRAVGAYVLAGPDAGHVQIRIDNGEWQTVELFHRFSRGLHYPRTVMFATDLEPGKHTLHIRVAETSSALSKGHAVRILHLVANGKRAK